MTALVLRDYQRAAVDSIYTHFEENTDNCLIIVPTGGGKSAIIASFIKEAIEQYPDTQILCLVHVRELVEQTYKTLLRIWPSAPVGVYSAGLGQKNLREQITMASVQSIFKKAFQLQRVDLILVDEAHLIPHSGDGMYRQLLNDLLQISPHVKMIGFTATHWRMSSGLLTEGDDALFGSIAYEVTLRQLLDGGYLVPPITKQMQTQINTTDVAIRGGEFVARDLAKAADKDDITQSAVNEIVEMGIDRRSWLIFCSGIEHALHVRDAIRAKGFSCETVTGKTPTAERNAIVAAYKAGRIRCLTGADVFLVGFDAPATDLLGILRPTQSSAMWLQIIGRGLRLSPETGKENVLVLDFTSNSLHFGPIDLIKPKSKNKSKGGDAPIKKCPSCEEIVAASAVVCPHCGHEFPAHEIKIEHTASDIPLLSTSIKPPEWIDVTHVSYKIHSKPDKIDSMRVDYLCGLKQHSEWVCLQHTGHARMKAVQWWQKRAPATQVPNTIKEALSNTIALSIPKKILIRPNGKYTEICGVAL